MKKLLMTINKHTFSKKLFTKFKYIIISIIISGKKVHLKNKIKPSNFVLQHCLERGYVAYRTAHNKERVQK